MNRRIASLLGISALAALPISTFAQAIRQSEAIASSDVMSQISMFNYDEGRKSDLLFRATPIAGNAQGKATVEYEDGNALISTKVQKLPEPSSLGPYTTYILWTLTPDGRATNQGVLSGIEGGKGELNTRHGAPQFAMIVTAEPHFAVSVPSTMIALYNVADDVKGQESKVTTLVENADYSSLMPIAIDKDLNPPEIVQARYSVAIADAAGAERFAPDAYASAEQKLAAAQADISGKKKEQKAAVDSARQAVLAGEDARRAAEIAATEAAAEEERAAALALAAAAERQSAQAARDDLLNRLNTALPTQQTDRGLVSEIGGVQFATGTADLNTSAREGLARFAGVVASYPGLRFDIEGYTDNTGGAAVNNELSLKRAMAVRDYLIAQGVPASRTDVRGLGSSRPIADNSTADGRARNRRVEIVVSEGPLAAR